MTKNEEKANEIGKKHARQYHHNTFEGGLKNNEFVFSDEECMKSALEMAEWKDQKFQEILDYAEICYGVFTFEQRYKFIEHIKEIYYDKRSNNGD
jgi:hypothetical protein